MAPAAKTKPAAAKRIVPAPAVSPASIKKARSASSIPPEAGSLEAGEHVEKVAAEHVENGLGKRRAPVRR